MGIILRQRIIVDWNKCSGCRVCEFVCSLVNEGAFNPVKSRIKVIRTWAEGLIHSVPVFCLQCEDAYCQKICPVRAISRNEKGVLIVNEARCIGCKLCEMACPVGGINVDPEKHVALKCEECARIGGDPQCVKYCFDGALQFVTSEKVGYAVARARLEKFKELVMKGVT